MALGFSRATDLQSILGWSLYQLTIDKFNLMFWFNDGHDLLNVAYKCSYCSVDGSLAFEFDLFGARKWINVDRILGESVASYTVLSKSELLLSFSNGDRLSVFDDPKIRSWWFLSGVSPSGEDVESRERFVMSDLEFDELTQLQIDERLRP